MHPTKRRGRNRSTPEHGRQHLHDGQPATTTTRRDSLAHDCSDRHAVAALDDPATEVPSDPPNATRTTCTIRIDLAECSRARVGRDPDNVRDLLPSVRQAHVGDLLNVDRETYDFISLLILRSRVRVVDAPPVTMRPTAIPVLLGSAGHRATQTRAASHQPI